MNEPITENMWKLLDVPNRYRAVDQELAEGSGPNTLEFLQGFYEKAYERIHPNIREEAFVVFHDAFELKAWKDFFVPGKIPYKDYSGVPLKPKASKACNHCGICAQKCPVKEIPKKRPSYTDESKCISCMRCVGICPHKARKLNPAMVFMATWKFKKVCSKRKKSELFI